MTAHTTACLDWRERIVARRPLIVSPPIFPTEAQAALDVFRSLHVVDVAGSPTFGEIGDGFVFDFVAAVFGAYDAQTAKRFIREFFLCLAKKNGKSTIAAGIMLTALIRNWRRSNEALILSPTIEASQNSFKPAADMVRIDPELHAAEGGFLHIQDHIRTITHLSTKAVLKVIAADAATAVGKKGGFILLDELWELGKRPNADALLREATGGLVSRPEGFVISITTQSDAPPAGVFKDKLNYARQVRDGAIVDSKFLPAIYEFPPEMVEAGAHLDPANFYIPNPNLGRSVSAEWLEDELRKEVAKGPETRNTFLAKHLNVEIGLALRSDRWAGAEHWPRRTDRSITFEVLLERCDVIVPGVDGGGLDDLFGFSALGRDRDTRDWLLWTHGWCHKGVLERRKSIAVKLREFGAAGELTIVDDELEDISDIVDRIRIVKDAGLLAGVCVDPAGLGELVDALAEIEVTDENKLLIGVPQGYALMNAIKTAERKLANGTFRHSGSGLAAWCVANLKIEPTATAIRATKQNAGDAKIDLAMAMFNAVVLMARNPEPKGGKSFWESEDAVERLLEDV